MKIGILGAGRIAGTMAGTINGMMHPDIELYAIASRNLDKANNFAKEYGILKAYGSYEEMLKDDAVDLVYIATPHSEHYTNIKMCIAYKKPMLVEKAFTRNYKEACEVLALAKANNVFITEAIWTRYMPSRKLINDLIAKGTIGAIHSIQANLGYPISKVERLIKPELAGGALLDIGIYPINFALMVFGDDNVRAIKGDCIKAPSGVDFIDNISLIFNDNKIASLHATCMGPSDRTGFIFGENGYIAITNINNPEKIEVFNKDHQKIMAIPVPQQVSGYEYEVLSCYDSLNHGKLECEEMPHHLTLKTLALMDKLRKDWEINYPGETDF